MYTSKMMEIFKNPTNAGGLQGASGIGKYIDDECGDFVKIYIKTDENEVIQEARFKTMGTTATIVASSVICKLATELSLVKASQLTVNDILEELPDFPDKMLYTLDFAVKGLNLAIEDYYEKQEKEAKKQGKEYVRKTEEEIAINVQESKVEDKEVLASTPKTLELTDQDYEELDNKFKEVEDKYDEFEDSLLEDEYLSDDEENVELNTSKDDIQSRLQAIFAGLTLPEEKPLKEEKKEAKPVKEKKVKVKENDELVELENEEESNKANKLLDESKNYTPVVEAKIVKDSDLKKFDSTKTANKKETSSAKAIFDSMFED